LLGLVGVDGEWVEADVVVERAVAADYAQALAVDAADLGAEDLPVR
jgi:hypothetical protein